MRHWRTKPSHILLAAATLVVAIGPARADRVRTSRGIGYTGRIVGVAEGGLVIHDGGRRRTVAFADIREIRADKYPNLQKAEEAYAKGVSGEAKAFEEAGKWYQGLLRKGAPDWLRVVVQWRMYKLYVESGRATEALDAYLVMARNSPKLVAGLNLPSPDPADHQANKAMLAKVEQTLEQAAGKPYADSLKGFRVALLLVEGNPEEVLPLLEPLLASSDLKVRTSAMIRKLELLLATGKNAEAATWLKQIETVAGEAGAAEVTYWQGRIHLAGGKHTEAALEFMKLPILYPAADRARIADALYRAGQAMQAVKAPREEIVSVYNEAVRKYAGTGGAERARRELARLGSK